MNVWTSSLLVLGTLISSQAPASDWQTAQVYDDIADQTHVQAFVTNDDGRYFRVFRVEGEAEVWIELGIPRNDDAHGLEGFPIMRVDERQPLATEHLITLEELGRRQYHLSPTSFFMYFPNADSIQQGTGFLYDLVAGKRLKVRYWTSDGASHRVQFSLSGSRMAIANALAIKSIADGEQARKAQLIQERWGHYTKECAIRFSPHVEGALNPVQWVLEECLSWGNACTEITASNPEKFDECWAMHRNVFTTCGTYSETRELAAFDACLELRKEVLFPDYAPYKVVEN